MKLDLRRTFLVGLAFLSISAFWGLYDFVVPLILENTYILGETWTGAVMAMDNVVALFLLPVFGTLSDKCRMRIGRRMPFILFGTGCAVILLIALPFVVKYATLPVFLAALALLLLAMSIYRSPAVALMPDVTPKPLRSKGNAVINLMGAMGGALALVLTKIAVLYPADANGTPYSDYSLLFFLVAMIMIICIAVLVATIRERRLVAEMVAINYGEPADAPKPAADNTRAKLPRPVLVSMILLLLSVSLWFMGYNAVTTAFSRYAQNVWGIQEGPAAMCMLMGTAGAIASYWPVGIISSRLGRKGVIRFGILLLAVCFLAGTFLPTLNVLTYIMFILVGVGWAAINVNSFPMVVEMASGADIGKYTGYYYTFSMAAQVLTPILSGALLEHVGYHTLFPYAMVMLLLAFVTFFFVRHGDSKPQAKKGLEALDVED